jgi:hypothetical protein
MMSRGVFALALVGLLAMMMPVMISAQGTAKDGQECSSDADCVGNLDCIRFGFFHGKRCAPISCAKGAAYALLDSGFDADAYIATLKSKAGLEKRLDFVRLGNDIDRMSIIEQTLKVDPPPIKEVFMANYSACLYPEADVSEEEEDGDDEGTRRALRARSTTSAAANKKVHRQLQDPQTQLGIMWSGAALFSYFGKSVWWEQGLFNTDYQFLQNCVGAILGADVGLDLLIEIFNDGFDPTSIFSNGLDPSEPGSSERRTRDPGNTVAIPVITAGPFGIQVGWFQEDGPDDGTFVDVSLGPSFGANLGGYSVCFNQLGINE